MMCPVCGSATARMANPLYRVFPGTKPLLRFCTNNGQYGEMFSSCMWEQQEARRVAA